MRFLFSPLAFAVALALTGIASAQSTAPTPIPAPKKPDLSAMAYFVGNWTCTTKSSRRPTAMASKVSYSLSPDGYWVVATTDSAATDWFPQATREVDRYTFDNDLGKWVDISYDDEGNYDVSMAPSPKNGAWAWHDANLSPDKTVASFTDFFVTQEGDGKYSFHSAFTTKSGQTVTVTGSCTKQP